MLGAAFERPASAGGKQIQTIDSMRVVKLVTGLVW